MFKVVQTIEGGEKHYSVVPSGWEKDSYLFWPSQLKSCEIEKLRKNASSIPEENWKCLPCVLKTSASTYLDALQIEKLHASFTDTESELRYFKDQSIKKRFVRNKKFKQKNSNTRDYNNLFTEASNFPKTIVQETDAKNNNVHKQQILSTDINVINLMENSTEMQQDYQQLQQPINLGEKSDFINLIEKPLFYSPAMPQNIQQELPQIQDNTLEASDNRVLDLTSFLIDITNTVNSISSELLHIKENQQTIASEVSRLHIKTDKIIQILSNDRNNPLDLNIDIKYTKDYTLPLRSVSDVISLDKSLQCENFKNEMIQRLSTVGGTTKTSDGSKILYKLMDYLLTPELTNMFTWTGISKKGESKECFLKLTNVVDMIYEVVYLADCRHSRQRNEQFLKEKIFKHSSQRLNRKRKLNANLPSSNVTNENSSNNATISSNELQMRDSQKSKS